MALQRALLVYNTDAAAWARLRHNGMASNFSWEDSALGYEALYERALSRVRSYGG
jgi:glycogen synthase